MVGDHAQARAKLNMGTSMIPPGSIVEPSPCIPGTNPLHGLWGYLPGFVNRMARIVNVCDNLACDEYPHLHYLEPT